MFLRRRFSKLVVIADLSEGGQVWRPEVGQSPYAARQNGLQQLIRAIHYLGPSQAVLVTQVEGSPRHGLARPLMRDDSSINLIRRGIQELNADICVLELSKAEGTVCALKRCHEFLEKRPTLLLKLGILPTLKPSYFGNMCDYGIVHDATLVGSSPLDSLERGGPTTVASTAASMVIQQFRPDALEISRTPGVPRRRLSGCFYLATDFWRALEAAMHESPDIDFLALVESVPGAIEFSDQNRATVLSNRSRGYNFFRR